MRLLPHLDQLVLLERGEAGLLARAVAVLVRDVTHAQAPVPRIELLTFGPLVALGQQLLRCHQREQLRPVRPGRPPKPWPLRVRYDQLVALLFHRLALFHCGLSEEDNLRLRAVVGKFQQKALNLSQCIAGS